MRRFVITVADGKSLSLYYPDAESAREHFPNAAIEEHTDQTYLEYINRMLSNAEICTTAERSGSTVYQLRFNTSAGVCLAWLYQDNSDGKWYDFCDYQLWKSGSTTVPIMKTMCDPARFCKLLLFPKTEYTVLCCGGKPEKPKQLKGIRQFASVSFEGVCKCQLFLNGADLYIKHNDYFSPHVKTGEIDPRTYLEKTAVQICHAWLRITNFVPLINLLNKLEAALTIWHMICDYHHWGKDEYNFEWKRFLESVTDVTQQYIHDREASYS